MDKGTAYSDKVKIGNWFDRICQQQDEDQVFLEKRAKNELIIQKTRKLFSNFFKEIELEPVSPQIRFGAIVQFLAVKMKLCKGSAGDIFYPPALSLIINERFVKDNQEISAKCELTVAPSLKPCVRNSFIIMSGDDKDRSNEVLKYGQDFRIKCINPKSAQDIFVFASQNSPNLNNIIVPSHESSEVGRGINFPVGLCYKKNTGPSELIPSAYTHWKFLHEKSDLRFISEGQPVPSNSPVIIRHCATNQNLAAEHFEISTLFGQECLVSAHTYLSNSKKEQWQNIWAVKIGN